MANQADLSMTGKTTLWIRAFVNKDFYVFVLILNLGDIKGIFFHSRTSFNMSA